MNNQMRLFSKELIKYVHEIYLQNKKVIKHRITDNVNYGWCRCCGEKIKKGDDIVFIGAEITDCPELSNDNAFVIHDYCIGSKLKRLKPNQSIGKKAPIQLRVSDMPTKRKVMDNVELYIHAMDKDRTKLMKMIDKKFKGNLSAQDLDRKIRMMNRGKIIGDHLRLIGNDYKVIRK